MEASRAHIKTLEDRLSTCKQGPHFHFLENMRQRSNNTHSFSGAFGYSWTPLLATPSSILQRKAYASQQREIYRPPGEQQAFVENRFFIGDVPIVLGSRA